MPARAAPPFPARRCAAQATSGPGAIPSSTSPAGPTACDSPSSIVPHLRQRLCRSICWPPITPALANPLWFALNRRTTPNSPATANTFRFNPSSATWMTRLRRRHLPPPPSLSVSSLTCAAPAPLPIAPCVQLCACVISLSLPPSALLKLPVVSAAHRMAGPQCNSCFPFPFLTDCGNGKHPPLPLLSYPSNYSINVPSISPISEQRGTEVQVDSALHLLHRLAEEADFLAERTVKEDSLIKPCRERLTKGNVALDPTLPCPRIVTRWRLRVPKNWITQGLR